MYDLTEGLKKGGTFLLNCTWSPEELDEKLPASLKKYIADNDINFYTINATKIASEIGLGGRINMVMQSAFFKLAEVLPLEDAIKYLKQAIVDSYGLKGEKVVQMNYQAVDHGLESLVKIDVPTGWSDAEDEAAATVAVDEPDFVKNVLRPMSAQKGDRLPVSTFLDRPDGEFPLGGSKFEKRGVAINVPEWHSENCIQCNQCSYVCPHAAIRPFY